MIGTLIGPELKQLIAARNFAAVREVLADFSPPDIAEILTDVTDEDRAVIFRLLPSGLSADVLEYLEPESQHAVLKAMGSAEAAAILNEMSPDDRTALLEELPGAAVAQLLTLLSPEERAVAQTLLNYPEGSVGRLMTPDFVSVREDWTIQRVLDHVRQHGQDSETLNVIYVTDESGRLIDDVRIREFLLRPLDTLVRDIHDASFVTLKATDEAKTALELFKKYDRNTLPVVDSQEKLLGIITVDDMLDVQEEQTTEEMQKIGGVQALDDPYMEASVGELLKKRAPWLVMLFVGELMTANVIGYFEHALQRAVILALFIPLITSSGGNSGSQASTLIIRAMALGEVKLADWWRVMRKEIASGLVLGLILGVLAFLRVEIAGRLSPEAYGTHLGLIGATLAVTVTGVVLWGSVCGAMLPLLLRRLGLDPATSSAPFVATLVDVTGLLIYFGIATLVLTGTVL